MVDAFRPKPLAAEITIWNDTVGYAGTLDLVAEIAGRTCIIDYKTKGTDRKGRVKPLDAKVVMQLVAGLKAEEALIDPDTGEWEPWQYGDAPILMGVALGETQVVPHQANPRILEKKLAEILCASPSVGIQPRRQRIRRRRPHARYSSARTQSTTASQRRII